MKIVKNRQRLRGTSPSPATPYTFSKLEHEKHSVPAELQSPVHTERDAKSRRLFLRSAIEMRIHTDVATYIKM